MSKLTYLILGIIVLTSCTSPLEKKFDPNSSESDLKEIRNHLDSTELMLLAGNMIRLKMIGEDLEQYTYNDILADAKKIKKEKEAQEAEQAALAQKALKEEQERIKKLTKAVSVGCFEKSFSEYNYQKYITYKFVIQNKSDRDIRAIKGSVVFTNLFDDIIKEINFVYDQPISAGKKTTWNAQSDYNQFNDEDQTLRSKDLNDMKVTWNPEKIIFADGSTLE
ncbi:MAG: hypothetical protein RLO81_09690 [Fulvivirga sp.]|uniref:hypothetical protein n=1 Tax=Fulvivirga sp. TaxID=1931237 RepID=UPI0032EF9E21